MIDPVRELKVRAELLHHAVSASDTAALERLRALTELRKADAEALRVAAAALQRKHCLLVVAREVGFASWEHARRVLENEPSELDFGTLLYGAALRSGGWLHPWFANYDEARAAHAETLAAGARKYLLAYKLHFFLAESLFIEALGLQADDADWEAIAWDWARPKSPAARQRLYAKILSAQRPRETPNGGATLAAP
jgi:hypothetical protein